MSLESEMIAHIRVGLAHHDLSCPLPPKRILLNPGNYDLLGWSEIMGIAVEADERVQPKRFRIDCDGSAFGLEEAVESFAGSDAPIEFEPAAPREQEPVAVR